MKSYIEKTEEIKKMSIEEFSTLVPARGRRSLKRGFTDEQKILLEKVRKHSKNIENQSFHI